MQSKQCFKCLSVLPLSHFYKHAQMGDGHLNKCKECAKRDVKKARDERIEYYREYDRQRATLPHRLEQASRISMRYKQLYPERRKAHVILGNAVRARAVSPEPCFVCGDKAEAHHADYSEPLAVTWLCPTHHKQLHATHRANAQS
jgi:hypothetical protein